MPGPCTSPTLKCNGHDADFDPTKRLRISAWVDHPINPFYLGKAKAGYMSDRTQRAAIGKNLDGATGILDDISLLSTFAAVDATGKAGWDSGFLIGMPARRAQYCSDLIELCHARKIQLCAGIAVTNRGGGSSAAGALFVQLAASGKLLAFADSLVKFVFADQNLAFDGLSFDFEINGLNASHAANMTAFYQKLSGLMPAGKFISIANGAGATQDPQSKKWVANLKVALGSSLAQPFKLAAGFNNIVMRPMAFDMGQNDPDLRDWHQSMIDQAMGSEGDKPQNFQMGIKIVPNSDKSTTSCLTNPSDVAARCQTMLRKKGAGLVLFAMGTQAPPHPTDPPKSPTDWSVYKTYNGALNPKAPPAGTVGHPVQTPLTQAQVTEMTAAAGRGP